MVSEADNKFTWVIKDFSSLQSRDIYSDEFLIGGCKWCLIAFPEAIKSGCMSLLLEVADHESLPLGWRRHAKFSLQVANKNSKKILYMGRYALSAHEAYQWWFDQKKPLCFLKNLRLSKLHSKDGGFLVNDELKIVAESQTSLFVESEQIVYIEIRGDPVYDVYGDEGGKNLNEIYGSPIFDVYDGVGPIFADMDPIVSIFDEVEFLIGVCSQDAKTINFVFGDKALEASLNFTCSNALAKESLSIKSSLKCGVTCPFLRQSQLLPYVKYDNARKHLMKIFKVAMKLDVRDLFRVASVRCIFEKHPDLASKVRSNNQHLKSTYMNVLLGLIETLCQLPENLSDDDLSEASFAVLYLKQVGFKMDWLEKKLQKLKERKKKMNTGKAQLQHMEE
ncbi:hypothetical protein F2Q68_00041734 [Brassica cretica]|uniref:MATH domain-containing protein n=1 Tax=Brassica cretica TaxID=69181 RepID=A0A8S9MG21_BRACR|nr:hypothetical protein F2Q68_00041734 [Brassica cretica]